MAIVRNTTKIVREINAGNTVKVNIKAGRVVVSPNVIRELNLDNKGLNYATDGNTMYFYATSKDEVASWTVSNKTRTITSTSIALMLGEFFKVTGKFTLNVDLENPIEDAGDKLFSVSLEPVSSETTSNIENQDVDMENGIDASAPQYGGYDPSNEVLTEEFGTL